jgi:DNA-binding NtrC family response regulator
MFDAGKIDENLYLFMGATELKVPSISELREDFPALAQAFLEHRTPSPCRLNDEAVALLKRLEWPGDAVQFEQVLADAAAFTSGPVISANALRDAYEGKKASAPARTEGLREHVAKARDDYVSAMLELYGNNKDAAARALGIPASALRNMQHPA